MKSSPYALAPRELFSILFKHKRALIGTFLVLMVSVTALGFLLTPHYRASARLLVKTGREFQVRTEPGQGSTSAPYVTKQEIINSEVQILTSRDLIEAVINRVGVDRLYPEVAARPAGREPAIETAIRVFNGSYRVIAVPQSEVIEVRFDNPDRGAAALALSAAVELYLEKHAKVFTTSTHIALERRARDYARALAALDRRITDIRLDKGLYALEAQRARLVEERSTVATALRELQSQAAGAGQRIEFLRRTLAATAMIVIAGDATTDAVEQARTKLLELRVKEMDLRQRYIGDVKPLQDVRAEMQVLESFIRTHSAPGARRSWSQRNPAYDDIQVALNRAQADAAPLARQIAQRTGDVAAIETRLKVLEEDEQLVRALEREKGSLEEMMRTTRSRAEDARQEETSDRQRQVSVNVIEAPDAPEKPAGPNRLLFALGGLALGGLGTAGMVVWLLVFRDSLITAESVERALGLPVLVSVPMLQAGAAAVAGREAEQAV